MRKNKPFFGSILQQVSDALHRHPWSTQRRRDIDKFLKGANALLRRMETLEKCRSEEVTSCIKGVLREARRLQGATNFDTLFSDITDKELASTTRTGFISRIRKLTRYLECSVYLCRIAKALPLFTDTEITLVSLDTQLFARNQTGPHQCSLASSLSRFEGGVANVASKLASLNVSDLAFTTAMQKALGKSSVHAEVQIVCYYELHPAARKPRIICSSKDACYLCNLFVQLHGMFHIPRTHGNLYPGWRLLPIPSLSHVQAQLNKTLEGRIKEIVAKIMATKIPKLRLSLNDNESTVFPFSTSLPTPASSVLLGDAQSTSGDSLHWGEQLSHGPESLIDSPLHLAACGTAGPLSLGLESPPLSPLVRRQSQRATPEPLSPNSLKIPETRGEPERPVSEVVGGTDGPVREPSEQHVLDNHFITSDKFTQGLEPMLEPKSEQEPRPTPSPEDERRLGSRSVQVTETAPGPAPRSELNQPPEPHSPEQPDPEPAQTTHAATPPPLANLKNPSPPPPPLTIPSNNPASTAHPLLLARDQPLTLHLNNTNTPSPPRLIAAGPMTIHTEFIRSLSPSLSPSASPPPSVPAKSVTVTVTVHIHWLPRQRAAAFRAARPLRGFVDLDRLRAGVEVDCGSAECVYLAYRGEVVVMDFVRGVLG